jgi:hypothetical protein
MAYDYLDKAGATYIVGKVKTLLSGKVDAATGKSLSTNDYTTAEKDKLSGIAEGANKTTVDTALSPTSTNPVQNKVINTALAGKVSTVSGKGLSTNDYTTTEKNKLSGIDEGANKYSLPTASSTTLGGVKVGAGLTINSGVLSATGGGTADAVDWSNVTNKPTAVSAFTNDSGFQTASQVESIASTKIEAVVGSAPAALDTLKEIADALGNDADFAGTITTQLSAKVNTSDMVAITNTEIDAMFTS